MSGIFVNPRVRIPTSIEQGDTTSWNDEPFTDFSGALYTSANYTLTYTLLSQVSQGASSPLSQAATANGPGWITRLSTVQTAALMPGKTIWQAVLTAANYQGTVARGTTDVVLNLALAGNGYDGRTLNQQRLDALESALAALTGLNGGKPVESYRIGTREMRYQNIPDILKAIAYYRTQVNSENAANSIAQGQGNPRKTYIRFPGGFGGRE
jgi:hypothetical protein